MTEERLSAILLIQRETDYIRTVRGVIHLPNTTKLANVTLQPHASF